MSSVEITVFPGAGMVKEEVLSPLIALITDDFSIAVTNC